MTSQPSAGGQLQVGGTLNPEQHLYIERREDTELLELLARGEYCNILSSRQVGKSSLIMHALLALRGRGVRVSLIDIAGVLGSPPSADEWYVGLLSELTRQQGLRLDVRTWWTTSAQGTPNQKLLDFFRDVLLPSFEQPLVVFLDEIDHTLKFDYTDDFFTAIRAIYNDRAREPAFRRLTFCLAGVATPNELVKNRRTTAYNIGKTLELSDFSFERHDLTPVIRAVSSDPVEGERIVRAILAWTGGHPFLTLRFCEQFLQAGGRTAADVDRMVQDVYPDLDHLKTDVHFDQISRFLQERLADGPATLGLYQRILDGTREPDRPTVYHAQLKLSGLVKRDESGNLVVRNRLYEKIFDRDWVKNSLPRNTIARYRRVAMTAVGVLLVAAILAGVYQFLIVPPRAAAAQALAELAATSDETVARARYESLTGDQLSTMTRWILRDHRGEAERSFRAFWERRAATLEARALDRLKSGNIDEACMLGAAAAVKRGGALHPEIQKAFLEQKFPALAASVVGLSSGTRNRQDVGGWVAVVEPDGLRIRLTQGTQAVSTSDAANELRIVEMRTGASLWSQAFVGIAVFTGDGAAALEIRPREILVWPVVLSGDAGVGQPRPAATTTVTADLQSAILRASTSLPNRQPAGGSSILDATAFAQALAGCVAKSGVTGEVSGLAFGREGSLMAVVMRSGIVVCDLRATAIAARVPYAMPPAQQVPDSAGAFSPDGHLFAAPDGRIYNWRENAVLATVDGAPVAFSGDGALLLVSRRPASVNQRQPNTVGSGGIDPPRAVVVSTRNWKVVASSPGLAETIGPDGRLFVVNTQYSIEVTAVADGTVYASVPGSLAVFSEDGRWLSVSDPVGSDRSSPVRIWDTAAFSAKPTGPAKPVSPAERWTNWERKFGLTLNENEEVVPLWRTGPRILDGQHLTAAGS